MPKVGKEICDAATDRATEHAPNALGMSSRPLFDGPGAPEAKGEGANLRDLGVAKSFFQQLAGLDFMAASRGVTLEWPGDGVWRKFNGSCRLRMQLNALSLKEEVK
jgi:hypothetical protein